MRTLLALLVLAAPAAAEPRPVVVTIVVDQLGAWVAESRLPQLPDSGGFARLRREGTWLRDVRYAHSVTDTAPGHAALYTAAPPRTSGIVSNERPGPDGRSPVSILYDSAAKLVGEAGPQDAAGPSLAALQAETLADRLRAERPGAWIVAVSVKDRGALFAGGRRPDAVLFFEPKAQAYVTTSALASAFPAWARGKADVPAAVGASWTVADPSWIQARTSLPDDQPGEGDLGGFGTVFPHLPSAAAAPGKAYRALPASDEHLVALGLAGLDAAPEGTEPILLALSFSANDYVGHFFGPDSWEAWESLRRLDETLARLFAGLDERFGPDGYAVVLSADHGVTPLPEHPGECRKRDRWARTCKAGERLIPSALALELQEAVAAKLGPGAWVATVIDPYVYLGTDAQARRAEALKLVTARLKRHRGVAKVLEAARFPKACPKEAVASVEALVCRATLPGRGGDLFVLPAPGSFFDADYTPGKGTSHGTPYLHDRAVPLLVRAPGRVAGGAVVEKPGTYRSFARTAADLLGIAPPAAAADAPSVAAPPR